MNHPGTRRRRKYRLNKKKLVGTIIVLGLAAALTTAAAILLPKRIASTEDTVSALTEDITLPVSEQTDKPEPEVQLLLEGRTIVVDAGHGGFDPGAIGVNGSYEAELNLAVAQYMEAMLEDGGASVIMTRENDDAIADDKVGDMAERRCIIEQSGADIVVSIHMNFYEDDPDVCGPLVLFMPGSEQGKTLAEAVQETMNDALDPDGTARSQSLYILKSGNMPCVLVECGYISNAEEERKLNRAEYQKKVAKAICDGIEAYFLK